MTIFIRCLLKSAFYMLSAGTSWGWDLGGGREMAPASEDPGRFKVHKEPRCDDLGH